MSCPLLPDAFIRCMLLSLHDNRGIMDGTVTARRTPWELIGLVVIAICIGSGLMYWSNWNASAYPQASTWQYRIIGFIWLLCMLLIFETAARSGRAGRRLTLVLLCIGGLMHAIRIGLFLYTTSPWRTGNYFIAIRSGGTLVDPYALISPFTWFLAIGCYILMQRWIRETLAPRLARLSSPVLGILTFLAVYRGLHMYSTWANFVAYHHQSTLPLAFAVGQILLPFLYLAAYVLLIEQTLRARTRAFEWTITGVVLGLAFTIPRYLSIHGIWDWLGNAGSAMVAIGLMALLVSFFPRRGTTEIA